MRKLDIMQEGGYPFDDVTIAYLQQMHDDRDSFLHTVFGDYKIVKGVILNVQTNIYSDGLITVDGKMFHFVGGAPNAKISKKVIETKRQYEDGLHKKAFINEFYEFGENGTDVIDFSELTRYYQNQPQLGEMKFGMFDLTNLDFGWHHCNGTNGTIDMRGEFARGADEGRGVDSGRNAGTSQLDSMQKITGEFPSMRRETRGDAPSGVFSKKNDFAISMESGASDDWGLTVKLDSSIQTRTSTETRPRNVAAHWIQFTGV